MKLFKADLHIHTVLSPCASLEMSPKNIVQRALEQQLDIIAITDHNSTKQCQVVIEVAKDTALKVYQGVEVTTKEEIHCLAYFKSTADLLTFQDYLDEYLPSIKNDPSIFGFQLVVNENEEIIYEEERLLSCALSIGIDQVERIVHELDGIFIPAHVNKAKYSIISQLGFIPKELNADAFEITRNTSSNDFLVKNNLKSETSVLRSSDAHDLDSLGRDFTLYQMESPDFVEFKLALQNSLGRKVVVQ